MARRSGGVWTGIERDLRAQGAPQAAIDRAMTHDQTKSFKKFVLGSAMLAAAPYAISAVGGASATAGSAVPAAGGVMGGLKSVGKFALDNKGLIGAGLGMAEGMKDDKRSRELINAAMETQRQRQAMAGAAADRLGQMQRPDLSSLYADPANPYARKRIPVVGGY